MPAQASVRRRTFGIADHGALHSLAVQIFIGTAVLMVGALILMSFAFSSLKTSRVQSEAAEDRLLEITTVESRLLDTDRLLNGYVVSNDPWYLPRIEKDRSEFRAAMRLLGQGLRNDPVLFKKFKAVEDRLAKRQALYEYLALPEHKDEVANAARSQAARQERVLTDELRDKLWDLLRAERTKRNDEHTKMIQEAQKSFWIAVGIVALSILSGLVSLLLTHVVVQRGTRKN